MDTIRARARVRIPYYLRAPFLLSASLFALLLVGVFFTPTVALAAMPVAILMLYFANDVLGPLEDVIFDGETLRIPARAHALPKASIRDALHVPTPARDFVRFKRHGRLDLDLAFEVPSQGDALLRAMGLDPTQRAADFYLRSPAREGWLGRLASVIALIFGLATVGHSLWTVLWVLVTMTLLAPCRVRVGADGVSRRWFFSRRMIPVGAIHDVSVHSKPHLPGARTRGHRVDLHLADQTTFSLFAASEEQATIVAERVRHVQRARPQSSEGNDLANALARGPRTASEWIVHLRRLAQEGAALGYRNAAVQRTDLVRVAADPALAAPTRLAAAVALAANADESERKRIADLAAASADPIVRDGMIRIADAADDAAIEEALLEAEEARAKASR